MDIVQANLIVCDNPSCDYKVENPGGNPRADISEYIDKPCPKCGENLLTQEDYELHSKMVKLLDSFLDVFPIKEEPDESKMVTATLRAKDGKINFKIHTKDEDN